MRHRGAAGGSPPARPAGRWAPPPRQTARRRVCAAARAGAALQGGRWATGHQVNKSAVVAPQAARTQLPGSPRPSSGAAAAGITFSPWARIGPAIKSGKPPRGQSALGRVDSWHSALHPGSCPTPRRAHQQGLRPSSCSTGLASASRRRRRAGWADAARRARAAAQRSRQHGVAAAPSLTQPPAQPNGGRGGNVSVCG